MVYTERVEQPNTDKWLVMLHGFGGDTTMWVRQVEYFKEYYNILLIDLPGHGKSREGIRDKGVNSLEEIGDILVEVIKQQGIEKADFMCMSLGCMLLTGILKKHPDLVNKVVLGGAVIPTNKFCKAFARFVEKIQILLPYMFIVRLGGFLLMPCLRHGSARKYYIGTNKILGKVEFMTWFSATIKDLDIIYNMDFCNKPVLLLMGSEDYHFRTGAKEVSDREEEVSLQVIKGSGHVCSMLDAQEFNVLALEFLLG